MNGCGYSPFVALMITNLGVTNVGMIGAMENIGQDERENGSYVSFYIDQTNRFIRFSSTVSYLHHATVLSVILGLMEIDQNYFQHWKSPTFILKNYDQTFYVHRFYIFVGICGMGLIGLLLSFYLGASGMEIAISDAQEIEEDAEESIEMSNHEDGDNVALPMRNQINEGGGIK